MGMTLKDIIIVVLLVCLVGFGFWSFAYDSMVYYNSKGEETSLPGPQYKNIFNSVSENSSSTYQLSKTLQQKAQEGKSLSSVAVDIAVLTTAFEVIVTMPFRALNTILNLLFLFLFPLFIPGWIIDIITAIILVVITYVIVGAIVRYRL